MFLNQIMNRIFQQNNVNLIQQLVSGSFAILKSPARSPDLSSTTHVQDMIVESLRHGIQVDWDSISQNDIDYLIRNISL